MSVTYLDTSAAFKLVIAEPESSALGRLFAQDQERRVVASWLLHTEMHCAAGRHSGDVDIELVDSVLRAVRLVDVSRQDLVAAGGIAPLRSGDAIHLATAVRIGADEIITYDAELAEAAARVGISVLSPA